MKRVLYYIRKVVLSHSAHTRPTFPAESQFSIEMEKEKDDKKRGDTKKRK